MTTKADLIAQCKAENSKIIEVVNGVEREITGDEYEQVCANWAEMKLQQIAHEEQKAAQEKAKADLLSKLGLTAEEAAVLLG